MPKDSHNAFYNYCIDYDNLGYDLYITTKYGKRGLIMNKRYSYPLKKENVNCFQICHVEQFEKDPAYMHEVILFLYKNIEAQENEKGI